MDSFFGVKTAGALGWPLISLCVEVKNGGAILSLPHTPSCYGALLFKYREKIVLFDAKKEIMGTVK
jgi:hypothetical protein